MEKNNDINKSSFWEQRYDKGEIGWDLGEETPVFTAISEKLKPGKVCILGCGNGYDAISFSKKGSSILINVSDTSENKVSVKILDEGEGFKEKDTSRIFKRFYSNRPDKFGEHSGLGLNIVKNLVDLHDGEIVASNRVDTVGAMIEIKFPTI